MTGSDNDFAGMDSPGTTSGVDAPESASSSADASTGFDFSGNSFFSGSDYPSFDTLYDAGIYDAIAGLTAPAAPVGMSPVVMDVLKDYQDRFGGSGDLLGLIPTAVSTPAKGLPSWGMLAEDPFYGFREPVTAPPADRPTGFFDRYSTDEYDYPASVAPSSTRSLAPVAGVTTPTQPTGVNTDYDALAEISRINAGATRPSFDRQTLNDLSRMGYGNMEGANPNNPTQTVDQMIAANNINNLLGYAPTIMGALTGFGPQISAVQALQRLSSGQITPGQVLTGLAAGLIGAKTGIPSGILEGIFTNNPGQVAGAGAQAGLGALVNSLTNNPLARVMSDVTLGSALNKNVSNAVGGSSEKGKGVPEVLDSGLSGLSKLFSGTGTPSQRSASTDNIYSDAGNNAETYAVTSAIDKAVQENKPPTQKREMFAGRYGPIMNYAFGA